MSDAVPIPLALATPPRRDRQIVATAAASVLLHLLLLGWILLPRAQPPEPTEPRSVNVELVPPSQMSSLPPVSREAPSSLPRSALSELSSEPASEQPSSAAPASSAAVSSEAASSAEPSSAPPPASVAASEEASAASAPPVPRGRPVVIPLGPSDEPSAEPSSLEDNSDGSSEAASASAERAGSSILTADRHGGPDAGGEPDANAATPPPPAGALHAAKHFYLDSMLSAPAMATARRALKTLPPEKRLAQTCNIEAIAQLGNAGRDYAPDALVASAFAKPVIAGTTYNVGNGAFRTRQKWIAVSYDCTLSKKLDAIASFNFRIGGDVTDAMLARFGTPRLGGSKQPQ